MGKTITDFAPGEEVLFHSHPCLVLEHRSDGALLLVRRALECKFGATDNFAESDLKEYLNSFYLDALTQGNCDAVLERTVDLTALTGSKEFGSTTCKVAPLTLDELRKYQPLIPWPETCFEWSATPWSTPGVNGISTWVLGLFPNGEIGSCNSVNLCAVRPAFLVPANTPIEGDGKEEERSVLSGLSTEALMAELARRLQK